MIFKGAVHMAQFSIFFCTLYSHFTDSTPRHRLSATTSSQVYKSPII